MDEALTRVAPKKEPKRRIQIPISTVQADEDLYVLSFDGSARHFVVLPTTKFDMSQDLEHAAFLHLTRIEWEALHRLAAVSGEAVVTSLLRSATPDEQRVAAQEFMERELADANRRVSTPSRISTNDVVKLETSTYSVPEKIDFR
ncbi:hypothetical protein PInf_010778 [Phytophthora infestans]|nr:hypothetical protein PInf_010778 [Phytophthora infestans]